MQKIIVKTVQDETSLCWAISVSHDGGEEFFNTGFIYADESYAIRKFCKSLEQLTDESVKA